MQKWLILKKRHLPYLYQSSVSHIRLENIIQHVYKLSKYNAYFWQLSLEVLFSRCSFRQRIHIRLKTSIFKHFKVKNEFLKFNHKINTVTIRVCWSFSPMWHNICHIRELLVLPSYHMTDSDSTSASSWLIPLLTHFPVTDLKYANSKMTCRWHT